MMTRRLGLALLLVLTIATALYASTVATRYALSTPATLANGDTWVSGVGVDAALLTYYGSATYTIGRAAIEIEAVTTTKAPTAVESKELYTNTGDTDGAAITLLNDPTIGVFYRMAITAGQTLTITPSAGESLYLNGAACAVSITSATVGSSLMVVAATSGSGAIWIAAGSGTWACNS
jgi:hypothetical protein